MIDRGELALYVHNLLSCDKFNDYAPNGLQVEGTETIATLCTAVTASCEVIEKAQALNADALLVHHGYFWRGEDTTITGIKYQRIARIIQTKMNLFAYHLPLDCHLELGNNVQIGNLLELTSITSHRASNTPDLLWKGNFTQPISSEALSLLLNDRFMRAPLLIKGHDRSIRSIAWCSGAAQDLITDAHSLKVDAYISGEASERTYYLAKELGINYFGCGHHATERYGIQTLGNHLANHFSISHYYIDTNNPI